MFDFTALIFSPAKHLLLGNPLVGQLGLKGLDRRQGILKLPFRVLPRGDLFTQSLPGFVEPVRATGIIVVDNSDRNLAIGTKWRRCV